jgi:hypothetical protein
VLPLCGESKKLSGQIMGFEFQSRGHENMSASGNAPAARTWPFGEQAVQAQGLEPPVDFSGQAATTNRAGGRSETGPAPQSSAGEAVQVVLSTQDGGEESCFALAKGIETPDTP